MYINVYRYTLSFALHLLILLLKNTTNIVLVIFYENVNNAASTSLKIGFTVVIIFDLLF